MFCVYLPLFSHHFHFIKTYKTAHILTTLDFVTLTHYCHTDPLLLQLKLFLTRSFNDLKGVNLIRVTSAFSFNST